MMSDSEGSGDTAPNPADTNTTASSLCSPEEQRTSSDDVETQPLKEDNTQRPSIQISLLNVDTDVVDGVSQTGESVPIIDCDATTVPPEYTTMSSLAPPNSGDMKRAHSVELVPPEELPDIDDELFDETQHVMEEVTHVGLKDAWRSRKHLANFLTLNHYFHIFVIFMVLCDVIVVLVELILDLELIKDNECRTDSNCPVARRANTSDMSALQDCRFNHSLDHCIYSNGKHRCLYEGAHHDIDPAEVFHYLGIAILSYFCLEVLVKLYALDIKFFKHKLEVFDAVVVITSLVLDITIGGEGARESVSLLILLRLWRVTRIFNGITLAVEEREKEKRHKLKHEKDLALKDVERLKKIVHELKFEIHEWRSRARVEPTHKGFLHDTAVAVAADETDGQAGHSHGHGLGHLFGKKPNNKANSKANSKAK